MVPRLIARGIGLLLAVVLSCAAILALMPQPDNTFFLAAADKWRAAEEAGSPKVLIVGGSNTVFGLDSRSVSETLDMPVVNLGLNAGLGLKYMLDEAAQFVGGGDLVIVSPEYDQFYGEVFWGRQQLVELVWLHPPSLRLMKSPRQVIAMARGFPGVFQNRLRSLWLDLRTPGREVRDEVYNLEAFNEYGDVVSHLDVPADRPVQDMDLLRDTTAVFNAAAVHALDRFHRMAREKGARVFVLYPTIPEYHYQRRGKRIAEIHERLTAEADVPILAHPSEHIAPDVHFFDTAYHLSGRGRERRTEQLNKLLRERGAG